MPIMKPCDTCGTPFPVKPSHYDKEHSCSKDCGRIRRSKRMQGEHNHQHGLKGELNSSWRGGRHITSYGYIVVHNAEGTHRGSDPYILEHRLVMERKLGRPLEPNEHVHHKDEHKTNNEPDNLEVITLSEHNSLHLRDRFIIRDNKTGRIVDSVRKQFIHETIIFREC